MAIKSWAKGIVVAVAAIAACGCHKSSHDDGTSKPRLAAFNAVADLPQITFLREEEAWAALDYGVGTDFRSVDSDQYDVNFDALLPGDETTACAGDIDKDDVKDVDECTRLTSMSINVLPDHEYVAALFGRYDNLQSRVYDRTTYEFDTSTSDGDPEDDDSEVQFFHWSDALGPVDVYIEPPGTNLSAVQVKATLGVGDEYHGIVGAGEYVVSLTAIGDPNSPLYTSENLTLIKQTHVAFAIIDGTEDRTSPVRVTRFRDQGGELLDRRVKTELRISHVARDLGDVDVFAQQDYTTPLFQSLVFEHTSDYAVIPAADISDLELDFTPAGNPGALLGREQQTLNAGSRHTLFIVKPNSSGALLDALLVQDHLRRLAPYATLRLVNSTGLNIDYYVIPHGNNVYTSTPTESLSAGSSGSVHLFEPGSYDLVLARAGLDVYTYGPLRIELSGSGVYTIVGVATTDATRSEVVLLDDFAE